MKERVEILHFLAKNKEKALHFCKAYGADTRIRTGDLILTKDALYLLSYISILPFDNGNTIPQSKQKCKRKNQIFPKILPQSTASFFSRATA